MAINKLKVTAAAQRYAEKGQLDRAIKEYMQLVDEDPQDAQSWLKIADLHKQKGDREKAIEALERAGGYYRTKGFYLKAASVYKQMLGVDPTLFEANLKLANIYVQLGLIPDALGQYQIVLGHYDRQGLIKESLRLHEKIVELSPENVAARIRLAEAHVRSDARDQAASELRAVLAYLHESERFDEYVQVGERLLFLSPGDTGVQRQLAEVYLKRGDTKRALARLQSVFKSDPRDTLTLEMLAEAFMALGQRGKAISVYQELVRLHDLAGDEEALQAVCHKILAISPEHRDARRLLGEAAGLPGVPTAIPGAQGRDLPDVEALDQEHSSSVAEGTSGTADEVARMLGDAEIFLKYNLVEKAAEQLEQALELDPSHPEIRAQLRAVAALPAHRQRVIEIYDKIARRLSQAEQSHQIILMREILALDPDHQEARLWLESLGAAETAGPQAAAVMSPIDPGPEDSFGDVFLDLGHRQPQVALGAMTPEPAAPQPELAQVTPTPAPQPDPALMEMTPEPAPGQRPAPAADLGLFDAVDEDDEFMEDISLDADQFSAMLEENPMGTALDLDVDIEVLEGIDVGISGLVPSASAAEPAFEVDGGFGALEGVLDDPASIPVAGAAPGQPILGEDDIAADALTPMPADEPTVAALSEAMMMGSFSSPPADEAPAEASPAPEAAPPADEAAFEAERTPAPVEAERTPAPIEAALSAEAPELGDDEALQEESATVVVNAIDEDTFARLMAGEQAPVEAPELEGDEAQPAEALAPEPQPDEDALEALDADDLEILDLDDDDLLEIIEETPAPTPPRPPALPSTTPLPASVASRFDDDDVVDLDMLLESSSQQEALRFEPEAPAPDRGLSGFSLPDVEDTSGLIADAMGELAADDDFEIADEDVDEAIPLDAPDPVDPLVETLLADRGDEPLASEAQSATAAHDELHLDDSVDLGEAPALDAEAHDEGDMGAGFEDAFDDALDAAFDDPADAPEIADEPEAEISAESPEVDAPADEEVAAAEMAPAEMAPEGADEDVAIAEAAPAPDEQDEGAYEDFGDLGMPLIQSENSGVMSALLVEQPEDDALPVDLEDHSMELRDLDLPAFEDEDEEDELGHEAAPQAEAPLPPQSTGEAEAELALAGLDGHDAEDQGDLSGEREEFDFLLESGLRDDAEALLNELRTLHGDHPVIESMAAQLERHGAAPGAQLEDLSDDEAESHFDLGVAFKEMGRYEKAINAFALAARAPERRPEALRLTGLCHLESGDAQEALEILSEALKATDQPEAQAAIRYDLASAAEALGQLDDAIDQLEQIIDSGQGELLDVHRRLESLRA